MSFLLIINYGENKIEQIKFNLHSISWDQINKNNS
jgi:hypothetical protein